MIMVLSHPDFRTERHTARIGDFSAANENCAESFMKVDDTAENDPSDTISSGQEMVGLLCSMFRGFILILRSPDR